MSRPRPTPPHPDLVRTPSGPFGWLDAHLLHEGWLARLGPETTAVLLLLALAADGHGASFFGRDRMAQRLGLSRAQVDRALDCLLGLALAAHRPWRRNSPDGIWQLLPMAPEQAATAERAGRPLSAAELLAQLGLAPQGA